MDFSVSYFTTPDGVRLAYGTLGEGPAVIVPPGWISNIETLDENPYAIAVYEGLAKRHRVIVYDKQGCGLSEREASEFTIERLVAELKALIDHLELDQVTLLGDSQGGLTAMAYAAEHPERVTGLALNSAYASGPKTFTNAKVQESILTLVGAHWGIGAKVLTDMFIPGASPEEADAFTKRQRKGASAEVAVGYLRLNYETDISELLPKITAPTLVFHNHGDRAVPFRGGQQIAMGIPNARFIAGDGSIHGRLTEEHQALLLDFLAGDEATDEAAAASAADLVTIMFTDIEGSTALTQRLGDEGAQVLLHEHNDLVRAAISERGGREVKHTGDGIMASFPLVSSALECAETIQRELTAREGAVRVRIGLNAGEPIAEDGDLFGTAVQLAARICDRGEPGQILASDVVRLLAAGKAHVFTDAGSATMKGFDAPIPLHEVHWAE